MTTNHTYSLLNSTHKLMQQWNEGPPFREIHPSARRALSRVKIVGQDSSVPLIPTPFKEAEAITSLKALEGAYALALADIRYGSSNSDSEATVDVNHATGFLFLAFLSNIDGLSKLDPDHYSRLLDTDVHRSQSDAYRVCITNMLKTSDGYFHFHGGLDASQTLSAIGVPTHRQDSKDYEANCRYLEEQTRSMTNRDLDLVVSQARQAGTPVYTREQYLSSEQGAIESQQPWLSVDVVDAGPPPSPISSLPGKYILSGIKVLDLTRVIAGPLIGRTLAEYGAQVLRVHNIELPDVPYYQVDLNYGKRACHIDLKSRRGKQQLTELIMDADVIIDGYRPGALQGLGFGVADIAKMLSNRGRGFVYLSENCHGWKGPLKDRAGWQQIADAVSDASLSKLVLAPGTHSLTSAPSNPQSTGMSDAQGKFWLKDYEPIAPPFPMADFGTGEMGAISILHALYLRSTVGGSYRVRVALCAFNNLVMNSGKYSSPIQDTLRRRFLPEFNRASINYSSNFNKVGKVALGTMRTHAPQLWNEEFMTKSVSQCFGPTSSQSKAEITTQKGVVKCAGKTQVFCRSTRFNGFDEPGWDRFDDDSFAD